MKLRTRMACVSAAAALAALAISGRTTASASDLIWDANGIDAPLGSDIGGGAWDTTSPNWVLGDTTTGTNVTWSNATPDSAIFGNPSNAFVGSATPHDVELNEAITVQNITLNLASDGATYNISDFNGGSLTLAGDVIKAAGNGSPQLLLPFNGLTLTAGDHKFVANDTPGDNAPELTINADMNGAGNVIVDNGAGYVSWGTTAFNGNNHYTGTTSITKGRLVITTSQGLGDTSAGTTISDQGTLSIGGARTILTGGLNISEPITIQRSVYSGGDYGNYPAAVIINNNGSAQTHTLSGPLVIDSSDARISVNTNTLVLPGGNIALGPNGANGVLSFTGDFAGYVQLQGSNPALATNGILITGGVEVQPDSDAALGGPTAPITMRGGFFRPFAGMTTFGSHPINTADLGVGINVPAGQTFTIDREITGGGAVGKRGDGTLSFVSPVTGTGSTYFDAGVVNVNSALTLDSLHLRSPVVNIGDGGSVTLKAGYNSFGQDSTGTNGGPDIATVNLTGNGSLTQSNGSDFNISDNPNTQGTINISDNASFTTGGITWLGKANGAVGTINQSGGTFTINRGGNFAFVIADGRGAKTPTGYYNLSGGTFTSAGEVYVGEGGSNAVGGNRAHGYWTQTGGDATVKDWFVIGREGAVGAFDMSGGTLTHTAGNMSLGDSSAGGETNTVKVHGDAVINNNAGEMWIGQGGGTITVMDVYENASVTNNNWVAIGRGGGTGTLNIKDNATFIKQGTGDNYLAIGSGGTGVLNQTGGTLISTNTRLGEASNGTMNLTGGNATFTGEFSVGRQGNLIGTLNVGGTANVTVPNVVFGATGNGTSGGSVNLSGAATLTANAFTVGPNSTGPRTIKFDGGTLKSAADTTNFIGGKITSVVSTGGANIDSNGHTVTVNSALTHDSTLSGADGGLTKTGAGTVKLTGANTYTGPTVLNGSGSVVLGSAAWAPVLTNAGGTVVNGDKLVFDYTGTTSPADTVVSLLKSSHDSSNFRDAAQQIRTTIAADATHGLGYYDDGGASLLTVLYTWYGDANLDGKVNADDYALTDRGMARGGTKWVSGDFNYDGVVNSDDYLLLDTSFVQSGGALSPDLLASRAARFGDAYVSQLIAAVPEPGSLCLLGLGAAAALTRRRRSV